MGSFYVTCSISGMSLTNQKTAIQLLVPSWKNSLKMSEKGLIVSNEGCQAFYSPFAFPIFGEYYDYGEIDNIVRDKNVEMLEDFFNLDIKNVINAAGDNKWLTYGEKENDKHFKLKTKDDGDIKNIDVLQNLNMTYFRAEVYEFLSTHNFDFGRSRDYYAKERKARIQKIIDNMPEPGNGQSGDMKINDNDIRKGISIILSFDEDERFLKSDGLDLVSTKEGRKKVEEKTEEYFNQLKEGILDEETKKVFMETIDIFREIRNEKNIGVNGLVRTWIPDICKFNQFSLLPIDKSFSVELRKQYEFICAMTDMYKNLFPSNYGSQESNLLSMRKLNNFVNGLIDKDIEDWERKYGEEYTQ